MKKEFSFQRREMLLFLTINMAAVTSRANQYRIVFRVGPNSLNSIQQGYLLEVPSTLLLTTTLGALIKSITK